MITDQDTLNKLKDLIKEQQQVINFDNQNYRLELENNLFILGHYRFIAKLGFQGDRQLQLKELGLLLHLISNASHSSYSNPYPEIIQLKNYIIKTHVDINPEERSLFSLLNPSTHIYFQIRYAIKDKCFHQSNFYQLWQQYNDWRNFVKYKIEKKEIVPETKRHHEVIQAMENPDKVNQFSLNVFKC